MKRWGVRAISNLWLLIVMSSGMVTAALAESNYLSLNSIERWHIGSAFLAQTPVTLSPGSTGTAVKDLQAMLSLMGYYPGTVDGTYTQDTLEAVYRFQVDAGLVADGITGPLTWQRLLPTPDTIADLQKPGGTGESPSGQENRPQEPSIDQPISNQPESETVASSGGNLPVLQLEDSGTDVERLQRRLTALGIYTGAIDGVFGLQTEQAVEQFQQQVGLSADGVVGPATWRALLQ